MPGFYQIALLVAAIFLQNSKANPVEGNKLLEIEPQ